VERFVAIDVEVASRAPGSICAIGAARFESRRETGCYRSLVRARGPIRFGRIHGLSAEDLAQAPEWPAVWHEFLRFLDDIRLLVAFRAPFDRGAILAACARHNLRLPPLRFVCAAALAEARFTRQLDLRAALDVLGLPFPGRHHDPLADARAAAAVALACTPRPAGPP
jgi:DNA polymerase-3 subunit epsilon